MTQDNLPDHRAPALGGNAAQRPTSNEPLLSLDRLLPGLRGALESSDRGQRMETIEQIIDGGSERVVPMLVELLQDVDNARSRQRIVAMLGQLGDARAVTPLADLLDDADPGLRKVAAWALGQIGDAGAVDALLAQLERESNPQAAGAIILSLARIGDLKALPALSRFIDDPSSDSLSATAWTALKLLGSICHLEHLIELLYSDRETVRYWAADRFVNHTQAPQLEHLSMLEKLLLYQERADVRHRALYLLGALENKHAREIVLRTLTHSDDRMRLAALQAVRNYQIQDALEILLIHHTEETTYRNREAIIDALGVMDDPRIVPLLLDLLEEGKDTWTATHALQSHTEADIPRLLLERLQNATGEARYHILEALDDFNTPEVIETLLHIARNSPDEDERCAAVGSLNPGQYPEVIPALIDILRSDASPTVCTSAIWIIGRGFDERAEDGLRVFMAETDDDDLRADALNEIISCEVPDAPALLLEQLSRIHDEEALASIVQHLYLLGDEVGLAHAQRLYQAAQSERLRNDIVSAMEHFGYESIVSFLIDVLQHDSSPNVRLSAAYILRFRGSSSQSTQALIAALSDTERYDCHDCEEGHRICDTVASYLSNIQNPEATAALAAWQSTQAPNPASTED